MKPSILTANGSYFDLLSPDPGAIDIQQIAHALSNICRFGGHCDIFYSVAQHSVMVSHLVPLPYAMQGLLHDATEAFLGDIPSPLNQLLPDYKALEARLEPIVLKAFGLPEKLGASVRRADLVALATERRDLMSLWHREDAWPILEGVEPAPEIIHALPPGEAWNQFLQRFRDLTA